MRLRERIGFFVRDARRMTGLLLLLGTVLLCFAYCMSDAWFQNKEEVQAETEERIHTVSASGEEKLYQFYLYGEEGYVNVYEEDRKTLLIRTSIPVDSLPDGVREAVLAGMGVVDEKELYGFLENYSS